MKSKPSQDNGRPVTDKSYDELAPPQPPARSRASGADGGSAGAALDTQPSNTVSNNSNGEYFKALRWGVDSLYLSYPGELLPIVDERLHFVNPASMQ